LLRTGISLVAGFVLLFIQALLVMKINGYSTIQFTAPMGILTVWLTNCVFVFCLLTQIKPWVAKRLQLDT